MTHFIVDLQSILDHPEILCYSHPDYKIYVDECYFNKDLLGFDSKIPKNSLCHFLEMAKAYKTIACFNSNARPIKAAFPPHLRSLNYINLIHVLTECYQIMITSDEKSRIVIVTDDLRFKDKMITPRNALKEIKDKGGVLNLDLKKISTNLSDEIITQYVKYLLLFFVILGGFSYDYILHTIKSDLLKSIFLLVLVLLTAWGLFILRSKRRLWYGALEVLIGLIITGNTILFSNAFTFTDFDYIKISTSIYIIIRGMDNMEKGLLETKNVYFLSIWKRIF